MLFLILIVATISITVTLGIVARYTDNKKIRSAYASAGIISCMIWCAYFMHSFDASKTVRILISIPGFIGVIYFIYGIAENRE